MTRVCHAFLLQVVLFHVGVNSLIAHIRVGKMQAALEAKSMVLPAIGIRTCRMSPRALALSGPSVCRYRGLVVR